MHYSNLRSKVTKGRFPFVRTDWPDRSGRIGNFTLNQNYPNTSVKS